MPMIPNTSMFCKVITPDVIVRYRTIHKTPAIKLVIWALRPMLSVAGADFGVPATTSHTWVRLGIVRFARSARAARDAVGRRWHAVGHGGTVG